MARDLLWVCDELYRLHKDLEEIRQRQAAEPAAKTAEAAQSPTAQGSTTNVMAGDNS